MSTGRKVMFIFLIGSLWGMLEILIWDVWHLQGWSHAAMILAIGALFCLALGRRVVNVVGSSLAIALVACFYKFFSVAFFACQMSGVLTLAASFEIFALLSKRYVGSENGLRPFLTGLLTVYPAFIVFVVLMAFVGLKPEWAAAGWSRVLPYLGWPAVVASIGGAFSSVAGWRVGALLNRPKLVARWAVAVPAAVVLWGVAVLHAWGI